MAWQDIIITICVISFGYALIPQIIKGYKQKKSLVSIQTALITSIGMAILSTTYITLNLPYSAIIGITTANLWTILAIQSIIYNQKPKQPNFEKFRYQKSSS